MMLDKKKKVAGIKSDNHSEQKSIEMSQKGNTRMLFFPFHAQPLAWATIKRLENVLLTAEMLRMDRWR